MSEALEQEFDHRRHLGRAVADAAAHIHRMQRKHVVDVRVHKMGPKIHWVESYVTDDKIYCVYIAESEADIRKHAHTGGFPVNRVSRIRTMIDPTSAD